MEREVLKNKYSNGLIIVKNKKKLKLNFKKVEDVKTILKQDYSEMMSEELRDEIFDMHTERARAEIDEALGEGWTLEKINAEIAAARSERKERFERARKAFYKIRADIAKQNLPEMTLDEVNSEIAKMREEMEAERRAKE